MNKLNVYRKRMINIFFISVEKDLDKWKKGWNDNYDSPKYGNYIFSVRNKRNTLSIKEDQLDEIVLVNFNKLRMFSNFKIWLYKKKIDIHFKNIEKENERMYKDQEYNRKVNYFKHVTSSLNESFIKETRKEKIKKLK